MKFKKIHVFIVTLFSFFLFSCNNVSEQEVVENLNGYWKIEKVEKKDGAVKEYSASNTIDYIEVDSTKEGYRMKVQPQIDSTYQTSKQPQYFSLTTENDSIRFYYSTEMDNWVETLISSKKDEFTVKNERGITYTYTRFESLEKEMEGHE